MYQGEPAISFSEGEVGYYQTLFAQVDTENSGSVGSQQAKTFLLSSGLDQSTLRTIWSIADTHEPRGRLSPDEFGIAMRLVAHAQAGQPPTDAMAAVAPSNFPQFSAGAPPQYGSGDPAARGRSPTRGQDRPHPNDRDTRKYARLFLRTDSNQDGFIESHEARDLFNRSGLEQKTLMQIWNLSDASRDGRLDFREFVAAMHLIRRARALKQPPPDSVPGELINFLQNLEAPSVYASQRSTSAPTSAGDISWAPTTDSLGPSEACAWASGDLSTSLPEIEDPEPPPKEKKEKTKRKHHAPPPDDDADYDRRQQDSPSFGHPPRSRAPAQPVEHLEALIEADKQVVHRLRRDIDELDEELKNLDSACNREETEAAHERSECERMGQERQHLTQQLEASRRQLNELKVEHQGLHLESVLLRSDHSHYGREAAFLQRLLEEGTRDTQSLQSSIEFLETSNRSLHAHTMSLEEARQDVLQQLRAERSLLEQEQQETQQVKRALESLKGGAVDVDRLTSFRSSELSRDGAQPKLRADDFHDFPRSVSEDVGIKSRGAREPYNSRGSGRPVSMVGREGV